MLKAILFVSIAMLSMNSSAAPNPGLTEIPWCNYWVEGDKLNEFYRLTLKSDGSLIYRIANPTKTVRGSWKSVGERSIDIQYDEKAAGELVLPQGTVEYELILDSEVQALALTGEDSVLLNRCEN